MLKTTQNYEIDFVQWLGCYPAVQLPLEMVDSSMRCVKISNYYYLVQKYGSLTKHWLKKISKLLLTYSDEVYYMGKGKYVFSEDIIIEDLQLKLDTILPDFVLVSIKRIIIEAYIEDENTLSYKDICSALSRDSFFPHYQPILNAKREIVGYETLLRWEDGPHISPHEYIAMARNAFLLDQIEHQTWQKIEQTAFDNSFKNKFITVNISSERFQDEGLAGEVIAHFKNHISLSQLSIEITEHVKFSVTTASKRNIEVLKDQGIKFLLDDFGTGYASLELLLYLPIDGLKIDKAFTSDVHTKLESKILCNSILNLADELGINVIAEGVETKEQFDWLRDNGCDLFQGYYFSKPLPFSKLYVS
jgi:EAL domain-containing protein (putative c-di-GMP-specific phosphodiesterase class I)